MLLVLVQILINFVTLLGNKNTQIFVLFACIIIKYAV